MQKRLIATVSGRVQMVMFRDFTQRNARKLGIVGAVKNNPNGTVAVVAEGPEESLRELLRLLHKGPMLAQVEQVTEEWKDAIGEFDSFDIIY